MVEATCPGKEKKKQIVQVAFSSIKQPHFLISVSSQFWGENFLVGSERKHLGLNTYFPSSSPNQMYSKKNFLSIFSQKFSIHFISPPNKYTLNYCMQISKSSICLPNQPPHTLYKDHTLTIIYNKFNIKKKSPLCEIKA